MATEVDQKLIDYISKFYFDAGFYPNYEEILEGMKWNSKSTVALHMQRPEREGVIVRKEYGSSQYKLNNIDVVEMAKELAELKKQLPPCKVGDTVHWVNNHYRTYGDYKIDEEKVERLIFDGEDWIIDMGAPKDGIFGKTVFLTKEEAEAKLKEMEGK